MRSLVEACTAGDAAAREALARWCLPRVRRTVILAHGPGPEVEDLTQLALEKAFHRIGTFRKESSFFVWVDRVTINVVRDYFKKKKPVLVDGAVLDRIGGASSGAETPEGQLEASRILERIAAHLGRLSERLRLPLILSMVQGYTVAEVAAILDISPEAAKKRLFRGRKEILARVSRDPYCVQALKEMGR